MIAHPHTVMQFSTWANQRVLSASATLPAGELERDRGAFFRSILGTLNHILLVDLLYRERIESVPTRFGSLDQILYGNLDALRDAQSESDRYYLALFDGMSETELEKPIGFHTLLDEPEYWEVPQWVYYSNLFQHQVHHRGQIHNMLSQIGMDPPAIGFIEYQVEHGTGIIRRKV